MVAMGYRFESTCVALEKMVGLYFVSLFGFYGYVVSQGSQSAAL